MSKKKQYLINKYLDKSLSDEEQEELKNLILLNEIKQEELNDYESLVELTRRIEIPDFKTTNTQYVADLKRSNMFKIHLSRIIKVASVLVIGISLGVLIMYSNFKKREQFVEVETKRGDKIHVTIPGNNEVWLNSRSSIKYAASFSGTNRMVELVGEAYFQFSGIENSPILIDCNQTRILCSNGSINIENDTVFNKVEIEVKEGWVAVTNPKFGDRQFIVESGFKGVVDEVIPLWIEQNKNPNYLAWHTGKMEFDNSTILEVAKTLSEVYDINIEVEGGLKYCFFTKKFNNVELGSVLKEIEKSLQINTKQENNTIIITGNPC
jgi:ferric-dicitrate binding protein FerR (iron transport regulator)